VSFAEKCSLSTECTDRNKPTANIQVLKPSRLSRCIAEAGQASVGFLRSLNNIVGPEKDFMRIPKILSVAIGLCLATPCFAADYSLAAAAQAAGELMTKDGPKEFSLFNLPEPKAKPQQLLAALRQARDKKLCLAICAPKLDYIRDLLKNTLKSAKAERFEGLYLIVVADRVDAAGFDELLKDRGITVKYGAVK
jgi:hypothetical protein